MFSINVIAVKLLSVSSVFLTINLILTTAIAQPKSNARYAYFEGRRVIAEGAFKTMSEARKRLHFLRSKQKFQNVGMLWIPDYQNLSGKRLYQTIVIPKGNCDLFLERYSKKIDRQAYCFNPSNNGIPVNRKGLR